MNDQKQICEDALTWALAHLGVPAYAGLCYAFCEDAYELGDGWVIHAWDVLRIDEMHGVESLSPPPGGMQPAYTGWTPAEIFLRGMREKSNT